MPYVMRFKPWPNRGQTVAKPLVITTIVLVAGFSVLMLSNFTANVKMGMMISGTISAALIFDFYFCQHY